MRDIQSLIDKLRGTTHSLEIVAESMGLGELSIAECGEVDQEIFTCNICGWWCDQSEEASEEYGLDEWTCLDCCSG